MKPAPPVTSAVPWPGCAVTDPVRLLQQYDTGWQAYTEEAQAQAQQAWWFYH